jgi:hypothetical protein
MRWFLSAMLFALAAAAASPAAAERPILLELFTSQGCSSCPPADRLLADLAQQPGVIALAFHVDYWDRLGWKDPYASAEWTERQRSYGGRLSGSTYAGRIYTPQLVIDGRIDAVGSDAPAIRRALIKARSEAIDIGVGLTHRPGGLRAVAQASAVKEAKLLLFVIDPLRVTRVTRGENAGQNLREVRIVRRMDSLRDYVGADLDLQIADPRIEPGQALALILQRPDGSVIGAATLN